VVGEGQGGQTVGEDESDIGAGVGDRGELVWESTEVWSAQVFRAVRRSAGDGHRSAEPDGRDLLGEGLDVERKVYGVAGRRVGCAQCEDIGRR